MCIRDRVVSLVGLVGLILTIRKKGNNCIIPVPVLKDRNTLILTINSFLMNFSLIAIFFFIPSYILYVLNGSATQSGLTTTLLSIPGLFMGPIYSRMIANKGSARGVLTIGMILRVVVHAAFIFILSPSTDLMVIYALMIIAGFYPVSYTHLDVYKRQPIMYEWFDKMGTIDNIEKALLEGGVPCSRVYSYEMCIRDSGMGADGDVQAVMLLPELVEGDILAYLHAGLDFNAQGQDGVDLLSLIHI